MQEVSLLFAQRDSLQDQIKVLRHAAHEHCMESPVGKEAVATAAVGKTRHVNNDNVTIVEFALGLCATAPIVLHSET